MFWNVCKKKIMRCSDLVRNADRLSAQFTLTWLDNNLVVVTFHYQRTIESLPSVCLGETYSSTAAFAPTVPGLVNSLDVVNCVDTDTSHQAVLLVKQHQELWLQLLFDFEQMVYSESPRVCLNEIGVDLLVAIVCIKTRSQSSTSSTTGSSGGISWSWGNILDSTNSETVSCKSSNGGLSTWSWGL